MSIPQLPQPLFAEAEMVGDLVQHDDAQLPTETFAIGAGVRLQWAPTMGAGEASARRFAASFIDGIIAEVISLIAGFMLGIAMAGSGGGMTAAGRSSAGSMGATLGALLATGYCAGMPSACGRTLGKMALGLRVIGPDGASPSFWRAVLRELIGTHHVERA
jgi:uncharacterized RDD family membrane protein YckC